MCEVSSPQVHKGVLSEEPQVENHINNKHQPLTTNHTQYWQSSSSTSIVLAFFLLYVCQMFCLFVKCVCASFFTINETDKMCCFKVWLFLGCYHLFIIYTLHLFLKGGHHETKRICEKKKKITRRWVVRKWHVYLSHFLCFLTATAKW